MNLNNNSFIELDTRPRISVRGSVHKLRYGFKSAILAKMKNCQNGTFEPVHEIQNFFWPKAFFWSIMKMAIKKKFHNMSQGLPNPGFMQEKVQKGDFL